MKRWSVPAVVLLMVAFAAVVASGQERGGRYLVVTPDAFVDACRPLAEWKTKKGMLVRIAPLSECGSSSAAIQAFIRNAHATWPVVPEFVLIMGGPDQVPGYSYSTDDGYGDLSGNYLLELPIGRLPAVNARECSTMVNKVLHYERLTGTADTMWLRKGCTVVREDSDPPDDSIYWANSRRLHDYWRSTGYAGIDSMSLLRGNTSADVFAAMNDGRTFVTYRGQGVGAWWNPFNSINIEGLSNRGMLPVVIGGTCSTMDLEPGGGGWYGDRFVRAGTPDNPVGGACYFGTTGSMSGGAHYRSAGYVGFIDALYAEKQQHLGVAALRGKFRVDSLYHNQARYQEWNLFGDPELGVWSAPPVRPTVDYDSVLVLVPQSCTVTVRAGSGGFAGALVCLSMDSTVYEYGYTDGNGRVVLDIVPGHLGTMDLVVTGRNLRPFEGAISVVPGGVPYLFAEGVAIDDFGGNGDGLINPGERFRARVGLRNVGGGAAGAVRARLRCSTAGVTVHDSVSDYGTILPDSTALGDGFELTADTAFAEGEDLGATLLAWDDAGDSWYLPAGLVVRAGRLETARQFLDDSAPGGNGNGRLGPGESGRLRVDLANTGGGRLDGVVAVLSSSDTNIVITDSLAWFGRARPGDTLESGSDLFGVSAGPGLLPGATVELELGLHGEGGTYRYSTAVVLEISGEPGGGASDPTGPDLYGYWCYDDTDTASGRAPAYDWVELAGIGQVMPVVSDSDAATITIDLPFTFRYYGQDYTRVSVCSNGFLALGQATYRYGSNRGLPDTQGAPAMVCPFWDDLNPDESRNGYGTAYQHYDSAGHRWIVQFDEFAHYGQPNLKETFQVILLDPAHHPTPTGDGELLFQYQRVALNSGCTVGIEDHTDTRALQYLFNNSYDPHAAWLQSGRGLRFTTLPPEGLNQPWLLPVEVAVSDTARGNGNGVFESGETLEVRVLVRNRGTRDAENAGVRLRSLDPDAFVLDSAAALGDIPVGGQAANAVPLSFCIAPLPSDSVAGLELALTADGYVTTGYFSIGIGDFTGMLGAEPAGRLVTGLGPVRPNPVRGRGLVNYSLARAGRVELALFDPAGRRIAVLAHGLQDAGRHVLPLAAAGLGQGVFFCRLRVSDERGEYLNSVKLQVMR